MKAKHNYPYPSDCITLKQKRNFKQKFRRDIEPEFKKKVYLASRIWVDKNRDRYDESLKNWYTKNKNILASTRKIYREEHKEMEKIRTKQPNIKLKYRLGKKNLTVEQYNNILSSQNNCCAICKIDSPGGKGDWHIDHGHSTDKIRGLLCHCCNTGLGLFKDNKKNLIEVINYLLKNSVIED